MKKKPKKTQSLRRVVRTVHRRKPRTEPHPPYSLIAAVIFVFLGVLGWSLSYHFKNTDSRITVSLQQPVVHMHTDLPSNESAKAATVPADEFSQANTLSFGDRVAFWSELLATNPEFKAKLPNISNPPPSHDTAPFIPKQFNCTTYVETVSALALSHCATDFYQNLLAIRYKYAEPTYFTRNHFPEADWIPNNTKAGILKDITNTVAEASGMTAPTETKTINRDKWFQTQERKNQKTRSIASVPAAWTSSVDVALSYVPIVKLSQALPNIPNGAIINFVRNNNPRQPVLITHQGFLIRKNGQAYLRHANPDGRMVTVKFENYVSNMQKMAKWPIVGINVNELIPHVN